MSIETGAGAEGVQNTGAGEGAAGEAKWYASIDNPDLRGLAELKGWKDPAAALESYRQLETTIGLPPERLLKLPAKPDDPAWGEVHARLGFAPPKDANEYGIPVPEGIDAGYAAKIAAKALELKIPKHMLLGLAEFQNQEMADMIAADQLAEKQRSDADMASLRKEWGEQFGASSELARRAVTEFGGVAKLDADALNAMEGAMGTANFLKLWAAIGSKSGEASFVDPGDANAKGGLGLSPEGAQAKIKALQADKEWAARKLAGGAAENQLWDSLHRIAFPD